MPGGGTSAPSASGGNGSSKTTPRQQRAAATASQNAITNSSSRQRPRLSTNAAAAAARAGASLGGAEEEHAVVTIEDSDNEEMGEGPSRLQRADVGSEDEDIDGEEDKTARFSPNKSRNGGNSPDKSQRERPRSPPRPSSTRSQAARREPSPPRPLRSRPSSSRHVHVEEPIVIDSEAESQAGDAEDAGTRPNSSPSMSARHGAQQYDSEHEHGQKAASGSEASYADARETYEQEREQEQEQEGASGLNSENEEEQANDPIAPIPTAASERVSASPRKDLEDRVSGSEKDSPAAVDSATMAVQSVGDADTGSKREVAETDEESEDNAYEGEEEEGDDDDDDDDDDDEDDDDDDDDDDEEEEEEEEGKTAGMDVDAADNVISSAVPKDGDVEMVDGAQQLQPGEQAQRAQSEGKKTDEKKEPGENGTANASGTAAGDAEKKALKKRRRRSPSVDVSLPPPPPQRPTIRLPLAFNKDKGDYMMEIPSLLVASLKPKNDPWAVWFDENKTKVKMQATQQTKPSRSAPKPEEPEEPPFPPGFEPPPGMEMEDLGDLARLLRNHPPEESGVQPVKKRRRRAVLAENDVGQYDTKDPFVDDSELVIDEPTHFARSTGGGFYVTTGPVQLEKLKEQAKKDTAAKGGAAASGTTAANSGVDPKKPHVAIRDQKTGFAADINQILAHRASELGISVTNIVENQHELVIPPRSPGEAAAPTASPMQLDSILNNGAGASSTPASPEKQQLDPQAPSQAPPKSATEAVLEERRVNRYNAKPVQPRLQEAFDVLRALVAKESFAVKSKFPTVLKPPLVKAAKLAVEIGEYNENFFDHLPAIFPYNRFTMRKLTKREFFNEHLQMFMTMQKEELDRLQGLIMEDFPAQLADYEQAVKKWQARGEPDNGSPAPGARPQNDASNTGTPNLAEGGEGGGDEGEGAADKSVPVDDNAEPQKKWKFSEGQREQFFLLTQIEMAMVELKNEKFELEKSVDRASEQQARKSIYKKIADLWPEPGWVTSTNVSSQYAQQKKKHDRALLRAGAAD